MHITLQQITESFGVSEATVKDWVERQSLPHALDRGRLLFNREEVRAWARQRGFEARSGFLSKELAAAEGNSSLEALLRTGGIHRDTPAKEVRTALAEVIDAAPGLSTAIRQLLKNQIHSPDRLIWAPAGHGYAMPHLKARVALGRNAGIVALVLLKEPLQMDGSPVDDIPVRRLLFFIPPSPREHLDLLARLAHLARCEAFAHCLETKPDDEKIYQAAGASELEE